MTQQEEVEQLWQYVYDLLRGPGRTHTYGSYLALTPKFEEGILNDIASLKRGVTKDSIAEIRGKVNILQASSWIGEKDLENINAKLDIIEGEQ